MTHSAHRRFVGVFLTFALCLVVTLSRAAEMQQAAMPPKPALAGALRNAETWRAYKSRFITEQGRVVDTGNGLVSHSEGQGYGQLLAVAANDRDAFDRIWGWTRANLMVRGDALLAWRWEPGKRPAVADMNNASDGDLLVAWSLLEADRAWNDPAYRIAARRIAVEIGRKLILPRTPHGPLLLPAISGFAAEDRLDGPIVNLSYWIFPAFDQLPAVAPEIDWAALSRSGLDLLERSRFGAAKMPVEWTALDTAEPHAAAGFPAAFAYNAIRIPLYLAWSDAGDAKTLLPFVSFLSKRSPRGLPIVDAATGRSTAWLEEKGYAALADLTACAAANVKLPASFANVQMSENYYPATLHLLAQITVQMRYPSCLRA